MRYGKIAAVGFGLVALTIGFGSTLAGGTLLAVTDGPNGTISAPSFVVNSENAVLLGDNIDVWVDPDLRSPDFFINDFKVSVTADSQNGKDVFVGVAAAQDVQEYLGDVDADRIRVRNDDLQIVAGTGRTALTRPADQSFWTATNAEGTFDWTPTSGEWAMVVVNADGSPGIDAVLDVEAHIPFLRPIAAVMFGVGVMGLAVGAFLLYLGVRSTPSREVPRTPAPEREPVDVA